MNTLSIKDNSFDPFLVKIHPNTPINEEIIFKITFKDPSQNYSSFQYFSVFINQNYINIDTNETKTTIGGNGKIGYYRPEIVSQGIGFTYKNSSSLMTCGGLIIGNSSAKVSDNIYGTLAYTLNDDYTTSKVIRKIIPPQRSDLDVESVFNDSQSGADNLDVSVNQRSFAWHTPPDNKYIVLEYTIKNNGTNTLPTLYAGLFMDFDVSSNGKPMDRINYDEPNKMSYTYSSQGGTYAGIKLLSQGQVHHYAFDKDGAFNGSTNSININDGFSDFEKYSALKAISDRNIAGTSQDGNDVADMISTGPFILLPGDSVKIAFALIAGDHLSDIQSSALASDQKYNYAAIPSNKQNMDIDFSEVFPNPANNQAFVNIFLPKAATCKVGVFDVLGKSCTSNTYYKCNKNQK